MIRVSVFIYVYRVVFRFLRGVGRDFSVGGGCGGGERTRAFWFFSVF